MTVLNNTDWLSQGLTVSDAAIELIEDASTSRHRVYQAIDYTKDGIAVIGLSFVVRDTGRDVFECEVSVNGGPSTTMGLRASWDFANDAMAVQVDQAHGFQVVSQTSVGLMNGYKRVALGFTDSGALAGQRTLSVEFAPGTSQLTNWAGNNASGGLLGAVEINET